MVSGGASGGPRTEREGGLRSGRKRERGSLEEGGGRSRQRYWTEVSREGDGRVGHGIWVKVDE